MGNKGIYIVAIVCMTIAAVCLGLLYNRAKANDPWAKLRAGLDEEEKNVNDKKDEQAGTA